MIKKCLKNKWKAKTYIIALNYYCNVCLILGLLVVNGFYYFLPPSN